MSAGANLTSVTVAVGTSAVQLAAGRTQREILTVQNVHATQILYIGPSTVATTTGLKVAPGGLFTFESYEGPVYGIADGAATDVRVLEVY